MTSNRERSGVLRQDLMDYFSLQGARIALAPFSSTGIPDDSSEWKMRLAPTVRGLYYARDEGGRNGYEVSSQLLRAADIFSADPSSRALDHIPAAVPPGRTPEVYRDIAAYILERKGLLLDDKYRQGQMTAYEISLRFPRFSQFMPIYFGQDGVVISDDMQFSTIEEGIALIIEEAHPLCMWRLPGLAAESYEALALFQNDEGAMDRFFSYVLRGGSGSVDFVDFFPLLAHSIIDHLAAEHPPVWPERN